MEPFDSRPDTLRHIGLVQAKMQSVIADLQQRRDVHDLSKLVDPELSEINRVRPMLKTLPFGSPEYKELKFNSFGHVHYAANDHHLEHFENGIEGMSLPQIVEMFCDWAAATMTHRPEDNIYASIDIICAQHGICDQIRQIFINTARNYGW